MKSEWTRWFSRILMAAMIGVALSAGGVPAKDDHHDDNEHASRGLTIGVIGDMPYTTQQQEAIQGFIDAMSADPSFRLVIHLGDIKSGSSACTDAYTLRSHKTRGVRRESPRKSPVELGLPRWVLDRTGSGIQG